MRPLAAILLLISLPISVMAALVCLVAASNVDCEATSMDMACRTSGEQIAFLVAAVILGLAYPVCAIMAYGRLSWIPEEPR